MSALDQMKLQLIARNLIPGAYLRHSLRQNLDEWTRKQAGPFPHLLKQKVVRCYAATSGARIFIETGTYFGFMLQACLGYFDQLFSIEIEPHFYQRARKIFWDQPNVELVFGDSAQILPGVLAGIRGPCLFWLDAHYSGGLTGRARSETPIQRELEAIFNHSQRHTILIDDANCFEGTHDYPKIRWIEHAARDCGYTMTSSDNIIRLVATSCES
jgi:hypothetical protein